jgi:hypothetical protein
MDPSSSRAAAAPDVDDNAGPVTRAVTQLRYGPPDILTLTQRPKPSPGPGEVVVRVRAASVNARDWHIIRGEPRLARLLDRSAFAARRPRVTTRGTDLAGVVEAVGTGVTRWRPGDAVFGEGVGAFAEYALAAADQLAAVPDGCPSSRPLPCRSRRPPQCCASPLPNPSRTVTCSLTEHPAESALSPSSWPRP